MVVIPVARAMEIVVAGDVVVMVPVSHELAWMVVVVARVVPTMVVIVIVVVVPTASNAMVPSSVTAAIATVVRAIVMPAAAQIDMVAGTGDMNRKIAGISRIGNRSDHSNGNA